MNRRSFVLLPVIAAACSIVVAAEPHNPLVSGELPQYIFFNKIPDRQEPLGWSQSRPESFTPESLLELVRVMGTKGSPSLRIGMHFPFSILENDPATLSASLQKLLASASESGVPVLITLDGQNWWQTRSDLWNWWDPALPGYDPANRSNVEWTDWGPKHAVKIGWRNWGHQIRVRPAPNIASPRFLAEHWKAYDVLIPVLLKWYRSLPEDRKWLFGGLKLGWEASINVNAYYHADGNRLLQELPADGSKDPTTHDLAQGWSFGNAPLGYAAVFTAGIKRSGTLTKEDLERVIHRYLSQLCAAAVRKGMPRHLIFTHQGGTYAPWEKHMSYQPAINDNSIPGWSFYSHDPAEAGPLRAELESAGRTQWAASEWWRGAPDAENWRRRFEGSLRFKQCRLVCVYNWEAFRKVPEGIAAVRDLASATQPSTSPR